MMKKLSIIIVNYNVTKLLAACIQSIESYARTIDYEIIVIDNASTDTTWKALRLQFPKVQFISLEENIGFSKANNKAIENAKGEYLLILNPDTELESLGLVEVLEFADNHPKLGCVGVRMHNAEGEFLPESKRSVPDIINSFEKLFLPTFISYKNKRKNYYRSDIPEEAIAPVEVITGAFMLIKKATYTEVGGLDNRYFMYGEDIDLCYTLLRQGYQNYYYGAYSILHHKGQSTIKDMSYIKNFYGAMHLFLDKYYKKQAPIKYFILRQGLRLKEYLERRKVKAT